VDAATYPSQVPAQPPAGGEALCRFALELLDETDAIALRHVAAGLPVQSRADATLVTQLVTERGAPPPVHASVLDILQGRAANGG
jgi:hypothetical protein